jgi:hypothetical protein
MTKIMLLKLHNVITRSIKIIHAKGRPQEKYAHHGKKWGKPCGYAGLWLLRFIL